MNVSGKLVVDTCSFEFEHLLDAELSYNFGINWLFVRALRKGALSRLSEEISINSNTCVCVWWLLASHLTSCDTCHRSVSKNPKYFKQEINNHSLHFFALCLFLRRFFLFFFRFKRLFFTFLEILRDRALDFVLLLSCVSFVTSTPNTVNIPVLFWRFNLSSLLRFRSNWYFAHDATLSVLSLSVERRLLVVLWRRSLASFWRQILNNQPRFRFLMENFMCKQPNSSPSSSSIRISNS